MYHAPAGKYWAKRDVAWLVRMKVPMDVVKSTIELIKRRR
jgi:hypothetical protein